MGGRAEGRGRGRIASPGNTAEPSPGVARYPGAPMTTPSTRFRPPRSSLRDNSRVVAIGVLLAVVMFVFFWPRAEPRRPDFNDAQSGPIKVAVPTLDRDLLATVRDDSSESRLLIEPAPLSHLLEKSMGVVPTVAEALGRPAEPIPIPVLQSSPESYRGAWLWYSGRLRYVSLGKSGHPVEGYKVYEGFVETDLADGTSGVVMFRTSRLDPDARIGEWVRVEGFFMKLRDSHVLPEAERAPLLVGPDIVAEFQPWPPVEELDPTRFESVHDGRFAKGETREQRFEILDEEDATADLESSQGEGLWHLAAYARRKRGGPKDTLPEWRLHPPFVKPEQFEQAAFTDVPRGTPYRLLGTFVMSRWSAAGPNPIGVSHWSTVWVQSPDLGGKLLPVWIPKKIEGFKFGDTLEVRSYYFKRLLYERRSGDGGKVLTPVFVAADLDRFVALPEGALTMAVKYGFAALVAGVIGLFYLMSRHDKRQREQHEDRMNRRRRERRDPDSTPAPSTS